MFEFVDEAFDEVTFFVEVGVVISWGLAVGSWWDDGVHVVSNDGVDDDLVIVTFVCQDVLGFSVAEKKGGLGDVMGLSGG